MKLSIIIPALNESESLPRLLDEIDEVCRTEVIDYEVIVVDDGSQDTTYQVVEEYSFKNGRVHILRFRRNCGKAAALTAGFRAAAGEYIITMDGDLQDNPTEIPELIAKLDEGADLVSGWKSKRYDPWHKTLPSKLFNHVTALVSGLRLHDFNCGLKAYRAEVVRSLDLYGELHRYIPVLAHWNGFKVAEKPVAHRPRQYGRSKYGLARLTNGLFDLITLVFLHRYTSRPLHLFGLVGLVFCLIGAGVMAFFTIEWALSGHLHIRPLMLGGVAAIIVGIQFVFFGLLGEMMNYSFGKREYPVGRMSRGLEGRELP